VVKAAAMTYIVQRQDRFYVVDYDGLDPLTGKERRRWHPAGHDRADAESVAARLDRDRCGTAPAVGGPITVATFLREIWIPQKRRQVRATTAYRYAWFVEHYIAPSIGEIPLRRLRVDHLEALYLRLATVGGQRGQALAPKTVLEVHMVIRAALEAAMDRQLSTATWPTPRTPAHREWAAPQRGCGPPRNWDSSSTRRGHIGCIRCSPHRPHRDAPR
jgi:hypothetical protein